METWVVAERMMVVAVGERRDGGPGDEERGDQAEDESLHRVPSETGDDDPSYVPRRSARYPASWSWAMRSCFIVSRSRTVTACSSIVCGSAMMHYGVPISSCRR